MGKNLFESYATGKSVKRKWRHHCKWPVTLCFIFDTPKVIFPYCKLKTMAKSVMRLPEGLHSKVKGIKSVDLIPVNISGKMWTILAQRRYRIVRWYWGRSYGHFRFDSNHPQKYRQRWKGLYYGKVYSKSQCLNY